MRAKRVVRGCPPLPQSLQEGQHSSPPKAALQQRSSREKPAYHEHLNTEHDAIWTEHRRCEYPCLLVSDPQAPSARHEDIFRYRGAALSISTGERRSGRGNKPASGVIQRWVDRAHKNTGPFPGFDRRARQLPRIHRRRLTKSYPERARGALE